MLNITRGVISYKLDKNVLFDRIEYGENFLILYDSANSYKQILQNFIREAVNNGSTILFYISHKRNQLTFPSKIRNYYFNIINDDIIHELKEQLNKCLNDIEKTNKDMLLISDWLDVDLNNCEIFLPFLEELIKRSQSLSPPLWRRKYKGVSQKIPFMLINTFETTNLNDEFIQQLIRMHQRVYLLQENTNTFSLPTISPSLETVFPKSHVLPQEILEKLAKDNLELITFLLLERSNKSGYQILKDIANHFHCILSQGTLYPLLYQLEKENKITKQNGKGREVIYSLTKKTKENLKSGKETYLRAYQHLASFF